MFTLNLPSITGAPLRAPPSKARAPPRETRTKANSRTLSTSWNWAGFRASGQHTSFRLDSFLNKLRWGVKIFTGTTTRLLTQWVVKTVELVDESPKNRFRLGPKNMKTSQSHEDRWQENTSFFKKLFVVLVGPYGHQKLRKINACCFCKALRAAKVLKNRDLQFLESPAGVKTTSFERIWASWLC